MAIIPVKKAAITALRKDRKQIYAALQALGMVHVDECRGDQLDEPSESDCHKYDQVMEELHRLEEAIAFLSPYSKKKTGLFVLPDEIEVSQLNAMLTRRAQMLGYVQAVQDMQETLSSIKSSTLRAETRMAQIAPWEKLPLPVEEICDTRMAVVMAGTLPQSNLADAITAVGLLKDAYVEIIGQDREEAYVLATAHKKVAPEFTETLTAMGFSRVSFEGFQGRPSQILAQIRSEIAGYGGVRKTVDAQAAELAVHLEDIKLYYDLQMVRSQRSEQMLKAGLTSSTLNILAWVKTADVPALEKALSDISPNIFWEISDPAQDEDVPVLVENNPITEPFSTITEMYASPRRDEIDPSPLLSVFYFVFFGMMVSDAGYGIVLALLCGIFWILRKKRTPKLIRLLTFGGISTAIWGALYGSWFGEELMAPLWFNPMNEPMTMLIVCFIMGFVQIMVGLGTKFYINVRNGSWPAALMDQGSWMAFLLGIPLLLAPVLKTLGTILIIAGAAAIVLTQGRENKTIIGKFAGGLYSLYGATSYMGDVLSYSRLFALGLATGVIAMVVNSVCVMLGQAGIAGKIVAAVVFIGGHVFNMGINVLGAYVHDARLQFVEFFGKFYEGGGRVFRAFAARTKYHPIIPDTDNNRI